MELKTRWPNSSWRCLMEKKIEKIPFSTKKESFKDTYSVKTIFIKKKIQLTQRILTNFSFSSKWNILTRMNEGFIRSSDILGKRSHLFPYSLYTK
jgi:hypothetical protein